MPYRNKTYVCFDADNDIHYYRLMLAWKAHAGVEFNFYNAHQLTTIRQWSQEETIKRSLRERLKESKTIIVLIGERTRYLYRFVRWEMEIALEFGLPIIGVNLNGVRYQDEDRCPPILRNELVVYVPFKASIIKYAIDTWPSEHVNRIRQGISGPHYFLPQIYNSLGL